VLVEDGVTIFPPMRLNEEAVDLLEIDDIRLRKGQQSAGTIPSFSESLGFEAGAFAVSAALARDSRAGCPCEGRGASLLLLRSQGFNRGLRADPCPGHFRPSPFASDPLSKSHTLRTGSES